MAKSDSASDKDPRRCFAVAGLRQTGGDDNENDRDDRRWTPWLSILFIAAASLALWALIIGVAWWLFEAVRPAMNGG
jgi:hypothetical protein